MSDEDGRLSLPCVERGWRYSRLDEDAFLFDERWEYLARVDDGIARLLPDAVAVMGSVSAEDGSLRAVLANLARKRSEPEPSDVGGDVDVDTGSPSAEPTVRPPSVVSLSLLGARIDVRCAHAACAAGIAAFYSASIVPGGLSSPEVVIWCDWETPGRYLFRSRPDDSAGVALDGVLVQTLRSAREPWTWTLPPIPPLASWPFKDRFVALHAAMVRTTAGEGVLIAGHRGSGKSTTALLASERLGAHVLCDETALIHCRTTLVEPFPHSVGMWRSGRKVQTPITEVCSRIAREAAPIHRMLFLEPGASASRVSQRSRSDALRELLPHHREAGASIGDAMQTLLHLAARAEAWSIEYSTHHQLADLVCDLIDA
ncbi:MAG: hypothetical protein ACRDSR_22970 [Pseudonocardiaceae bacterium]